MPQLLALGAELTSKLVRGAGVVAVWRAVVAAVRLPGRPPFELGDQAGLYIAAVFLDSLVARHRGWSIRSLRQGVHRDHLLELLVVCYAATAFFHAFL
jgi:hypothetical protein